MRVVCQTTPPKQEGVLWGKTDPVFHYWRYTLLIQRFPLAFNPITFTVNIMIYMQACEVAHAARLLQDGLSVRPVASRLGVSLSVISRAWRILRETDQYCRRAGQGRRRATTHKKDRSLVLSARRFRRSTARFLQGDLQHGTGVQISDQTVRNRLHSSDLRSLRPFVGLFLTPHHRATRRLFARENQNWQVCHWRPALFTNESPFNLSGSDGHVRVWRSTGESYHICNIIQHNRFGDGSVMVWGGISLGGRTELYVLNRGNLTGARYNMRSLDLFLSLHWCRQSWVFPGTRQCLTSCGKSVPAIFRR